MQVRHPEAIDGVGGHCPHTVTLGGDTYDCADGATFDVPEREAEALADRYGVDLADIRAGEAVCGAEMSDGSTCERPADECPYH